MDNINVLSLFDGISCAQESLRRLNITINNYYASEIKKSAITCTLDNFPYTQMLGNVMNINLKKLPKIDLLVGGSPCQDLSLLNTNRQGLQGKKSKLFWEYVRVLNTIKPKYYLLENVAGMSKQDRDTISKILKVQPIRINSNLVSYQNRDRLYWTNIPNVTVPEDRNISYQDFKDTDITYCDKFTAKKTKSALDMWGNGKNGNCPNVTNRKKINCIKTSQRSWNNAGLVEYRGFCRYLTTRELEQGQTLPIGYTKSLSIGQAENVIGDGFTVEVIMHILKNIKDL